MRTYSGINPSTTLSIADMFTIRRIDGEVIRLTSWPLPISIIGGSDTWTPAAGLVLGDIAERMDGTPSSTTLQFACTDDGPITPRDVAFKLYDRAVLSWDLCDADNPTALDFHFYGRVGSVSKPLHGQVVFDLQNPRGFPRRNLVPVFQVMCRFEFADPFCAIPAMRPYIIRNTAYGAVGYTSRFNEPGPSFANAYFEVQTPGTTAAVAPTFDYTPGNTTTDGTVVWIARNPWERIVTIATVTDRRTLTLTALPDVRAVDGWYAPGRLHFLTGINKYRIFKIATWTQSSLELQTFLEAGLFAVPGDVCFIWPACDLTPTMCHDKYANSRRFGGFKDYEGAKAAKQLS